MVVVFFPHVQEVDKSSLSGPITIIWWASFQYNMLDMHDNDKKKLCALILALEQNPL